MIVLLMGVSGAGKTTIGSLLAARLGWPFHDADTLHPAANVDKMRRGAPLDEADRAPWLAAVRALLDATLAAGGDAVVACSALRRHHREALGLPRDGATLVWLRGAAPTLAARLAARQGHFMPASLLGSQLAALEPPEDAIVVDVDVAPDAVVAAIRARLGR